jgi:hypothetical protein
MTCLLSLFFLTNPGFSAAPKSYHYSKLTQAGIQEITITKPAKPGNLDDESSLKALKIQRETTSLEKSKWKSLSKKDDLKMIILGDTGCRLKEGKKSDTFQDCTDPKAWPFAQVIQQVAKEKADLIIHVGDYHYREDCSKGKPCQKMSTVTGYGWGPWEKDFFEPANPAFKNAPWIFVRGNHEDCNRAFLGYSLLLANEVFSETCSTYEEPDLIPLKDLLLVNLDSSMISEYPEQDPVQFAAWTKRLQQL